jgi:hypothetical protein
LPLPSGGAPAARPAPRAPAASRPAPAQRALAPADDDLALLDDVPLVEAAPGEAADEAIELLDEASPLPARAPSAKPADTKPTDLFETPGSDLSDADEELEKA